MTDGIKILDLWVSVAALLTNDRLLFPLPIHEQAGAVLTDLKRYATDRGLTFTLIPSKAGDRMRCELQGSLHRYGRGGLHNADQFTVRDLLAALDQLVTTYGIDPFRSRLNNVEFGVNVLLPFPVSRVLNNLISYKNRPFTKEPGSGRSDARFDYYQCHTQRYVVKLYAKGQQYPEIAGPGRAGHLLRVEVKALKMEYLTRRGIHLDTLADLLNVANYGALGALLVEVFSTILFDEPTISVDHLTTKERDTYQNGRNPRFWSIPDDLTGKDYERSRKALQRTEQRFRTLLDKHRAGGNWQRETAALIGQTWQHLTTTDDDLLTTIEQRRAVWQMLRNVKVDDPTQPRQTANNEPEPGRETLPAKPQKCPKLTGVSDDVEKGELSQINRLSVVLIRDNDPPQPTDTTGGRETVATAPGSGETTGHFADGPLPPLVGQRSRTDEPTGAAAVVAGESGEPRRFCIVTGLDITHQRAGSRFVTPSTVRQWYDLDRAAFDALAGQYLTPKQAGANLDKQGYHIAHNIRNAYTNPRNNPVRVLKKYGPVVEGQTLPLFTAADTVRLTDRHLTALDHRRGTPYELRLQ